MNDAHITDSPDEALERTRQEDPLTELDPPLPEDGDRPAAPASDLSKPLPADHPAHDNEADSSEAYEAGEDAATGFEEPKKDPLT